MSEPSQSILCTLICLSFKNAFQELRNHSKSEAKRLLQTGKETLELPKKARELDTLRKGDPRKVALENARTY